MTGGTRQFKIQTRASAMPNEPFEVNGRPYQLRSTLDPRMVDRTVEIMNAAIAAGRKTLIARSQTVADLSDERESRFLDGAADDDPDVVKLDERIDKAAAEMSAAEARTRASIIRALTLFFADADADLVATVQTATQLQDVVDLVGAVMDAINNPPDPTTVIDAEAEGLDPTGPPSPTRSAPPRR